MYMQTLWAVRENMNNPERRLIESIRNDVINQKPCDICGDTSYKARLYDARPYLMRGRCCDRWNFRLVVPRRVEIALAYRRGLRRY